MSSVIDSVEDLNEMRDEIGIALNVFRPCLCVFPTARPASLSLLPSGDKQMVDMPAPPRSACHALRGMAATSHPLASLAAIDTLRIGGNAVDAAIAANAVLCVVEPMGTGIGGDCFVLCWIAKEERFVAINGSGHSPQALTADWLDRHGYGCISETSVHAVTVPGAIDAWCRLNADHGRLPMQALLEPAIHYAENGFAVSPVVASEWSSATKKLSADPNTAKTYLNHGRAPSAGQKMSFPGLAHAFRQIATLGRDAFYEGSIARDLVAYLNSLGGLHTLEDFKAQRSFYVEPIRSRYRNAEVIQMPPNSQGLAACLILNILSQFDLQKQAPVSADRFHLIAEATRIAFNIRDAVTADPAFIEAQMDSLLSTEHAKRWSSAINEDRAMSGTPPGLSGERDTVVSSVVDEDRNICSFVNSLYFQFGSGLSSPEFSIMLHNRGLGFHTSLGHPNSPGGRKRPSHTLLPGMVFKEGRPWISLGVKGAAFQPIGQASIIASVVDNGVDLQAAIDAPRCGYNNEGVLEVEAQMPRAIKERLAALGHRVADAKAPLGGAQGILLDHRNGSLLGASDPRKDGVALGY